MRTLNWISGAGAFLLAAGATLFADGAYITNLITGKGAFVDAKDVKPGMFRKITANDLPKPYDTSSASNTKAATRPAGAMPKAPIGFSVELYLDNLKNPRQIRMAPNGDFFLTETSAGEIKVLRGRTRRRQAAARRNLRHRTSRRLRNQFLSGRREPSVGLCGQHRFGGSFSL